MSPLRREEGGKTDIQFLFKGIGIIVLLRACQGLFEIYLRVMYHRWSTGDASTSGAEERGEIKRYRL